MPRSPEQRQLLRRQCELLVGGFDAPTPAEEFHRLAAWCEADDVEHDNYGDGALVSGFEAKIAALLGKAAAVFMPSGIMAQSIAVRLWCEAAHLDRFGLHPTSHLSSYEEESHAALIGAQAVPVGHRLRPMTAADLEAVRQPLACVLVELPIREAGGQLPTWDELQSLKSAARSRGTRLHMDGARLWECAAGFGKSHAEIAEGFDSVYVSLYKGVGAFAGAMLAGDDDFIATARLWRRRMGGTLHHMSPMVAAAAMRFDARIAMMPALYRRTVEFAAGLTPIAGLRVNPAVPQVNMLHLYFDAPVEAVLEARDDIAEDARAWLVDGVRPAEVPGWSVTEIYVGDRLAGIADERVIPLFARLADSMKHAR